MYEHIRRNNILVVPSRTCIMKYLKTYQSGFGFNPKTFEAIAVKTKNMEKFNCHGGLVFDEIKLSEHLHVKSSGKIEGFVDLGKFTEESQRQDESDHGLVIMFQPFAETWVQVIGVFAAKGNVKAPTLSKMLLEAVVLCENAGLFVDYLTGDGASWNRQMWRMFGIKATKSTVTYKLRHPRDEQRSLHFVSDFHTS